MGEPPVFSKFMYANSRVVHAVDTTQVQLTHRRKPGRQKYIPVLWGGGLVPPPPKNTETTQMYSLRVWGRGSACNPFPSEVFATIAGEAAGLGWWRVHLPIPRGNSEKRSTKNRHPVAVDLHIERENVWNSSLDKKLTTPGDEPGLSLPRREISTTDNAL